MDAHAFPSLRSLTLEPGSPAPLGTTLDADGVNFAVYSHHATRVTLVVFTPGGRESRAFELDALHHRTGDVWHAYIAGLPAGAEYGYQVDSSATGPQHRFDPARLLLDPYAVGIAGSERWAERVPGGRERRAVVCDLAYDWGDDRFPATPLAESVIHETSVRAFTAHASSGVKHPGTFAGLAEKAAWLRELGVTAVQLMPVAEFEETDNLRTNGVTGEPLLNAWGYASLAFMAPRTAYAARATAAGAIAEFRAMVKTLHAHGIEVILDVVFNHTGEGRAHERATSWRGLDAMSYYLLDAQGRDIDHTGCGNTFACARPAASQLILDALRFWAREMHVDGFRFDLAATLTRGEHGDELADPPLVRAIAEDPALAHCKLIAEAWDGGLYQVGRFPHHRRWAELNGKFRDDVRDWLRGAARGPGALATRLSGSSDLYAPDRTPGHSVNFVTCHDGFTLADLVSHEQKYNVANGEGSRDGTDEHRSWNGGVEGPTQDPTVLRVRARQARNAAVLTVLSRGAVLWLWGDDRLRTQYGNNNAWCHDGPEWWLDWSESEDARAFGRFVRGLMHLRREHAVLRGGDWFRTGGAGGVTWTGATLDSPRWDDGGRLLQMHVHSDTSDEPAFLLQINGEPDDAMFTLPEPSEGRAWHLVVDTGAPAPHDWTPLSAARAMAAANDHLLPARTIRVLAAK